MPTDSEKVLSERMRVDASMEECDHDCGANAYADEVAALEQRIADLEAKLGEALAEPTEDELLAIGEPKRFTGYHYTPPWLSIAAWRVRLMEDKP